MRHGLKSLLVVASLSCGLAQTFLDSSAFRELDAAERQAITRAAAVPEVNAFLAQYPLWRAEAYADDETYWHVDFYDGDDVVGYTHIYLESGEIDAEETRLPRRLSEEERSDLEAELRAVAFHDAEVLSRLGLPDSWNSYTDYDFYDDVWRTVFRKGLERLTVEFARDGERFIVGRLYDPRAFDEAEARRVARDEAIGLAYSAPDIDTALAGRDNWTTYAEQQGEQRWVVEFAAGGKRLMTVLVDLGEGRVLSVELP